MPLIDKYCLIAFMMWPSRHYLYFSLVLFAMQGRHFPKLRTFLSWVAHSGRLICLIQTCFGRMSGECCLSLRFKNPKVLAMAWVKLRIKCQRNLSFSLFWFCGIFFDKVIVPKRSFLVGLELTTSYLLEPLQPSQTTIIRPQRSQNSHIETLHAQPAGCMHAKSSITPANPKVVSLLRPTNFQYTNVQLSQLSQLMLNLYVVSCAGSFSHHAVNMLSLCAYYDLCGAD